MYVNAIEKPVGCVATWRQLNDRGVRGGGVRVFFCIYSII